MSTNKTTSNSAFLTQLNAFVAEHGTAIFKRRWAAGLAKVSEVVEMITTRELARLNLGTLNIHPPHRRIVPGVGPFTESQKDSLTDEQFYQTELILAKLPPGARVTYHQQTTQINMTQICAIILRAAWMCGYVQIERDFVIGTEQRRTE